jgi:hypothetical protein
VPREGHRRIAQGFNPGWGGREPDDRIPSDTRVAFISGKGRKGAAKVTRASVEQTFQGDVWRWWGDEKRGRSGIISVMRKRALGSGTQELLRLPSLSETSTSRDAVTKPAKTGRAGKFPVFKVPKGAPILTLEMIKAAEADD